MHISRILTLETAGLAVATPLVSRSENATNVRISSATVNAIVEREFTNHRLKIDVTNAHYPGTLFYVTGTDAAGRLVFVHPDNNQYYYPSAQSTTEPETMAQNLAFRLGDLETTTSITIPDWLESGRVYTSEKPLHFRLLSTAQGTKLVEPSVANIKDPNININWAFVELTWTKSGLWANPTYVDFVPNLPISIHLQRQDGSVQSSNGMALDSAVKICNDLEEQSENDGQAWKDLCVRQQGDPTGTPLRVIAPNIYISRFSTTNTSAPFYGYFESSADEVWKHYDKKTGNILYINTQNECGIVGCQVKNDQMFCEGGNRPFPKPSTSDIMGCNTGPFENRGMLDNKIVTAVVPRLCAAFQRTTLLLHGGEHQPYQDVSQYYKSSPTNYYSAYVHKEEPDGTGYGFAYDDVNPDGVKDASNTLSDGAPKVLEIQIGARSSR